MRSITAYILRQVAWPLVFAAVSLAGVIWLTQSLRFIDRIVNNNLSIASFFHLTLLVLPGVLTIILPIAAFCATLYAYNRLSGDSELIVLAAAGHSRGRLARPAILVSGALMLVMYLLLLYLGPLGARTLRTMQYEFRSDLAGLVIMEGVFNTPSPNLTVYVRERSVEGEMLGILVHDNRDAQRPITMMAERAALVRTGAGPRLLMVNGNRQQVEQGRRSLSLLYFDNYSLDLTVYAKQDSEGWREPSERMLHELLYPDMNDADDRANAPKLRVEAHRRLVTPFYVPALMLIAVAGVTGGQFSRRGQGKRLAATAVAAIALQVASLSVIQMANKVPAMIPLMYVVPILAGGIAAFVLREPARTRQGAPLPQEAG